jgi:hypothetical protein
MFVEKLIWATDAILRLIMLPIATINYITGCLQAVIDVDRNTCLIEFVLLYHAVNETLRFCPVMVTCSHCQHHVTSFAWYDQVFLAQESEVPWAEALNSFLSAHQAQTGDCRKSNALLSVHLSPASLQKLMITAN